MYKLYNQNNLQVFISEDETVTIRNKGVDVLIFTLDELEDIAMALDEVRWDKPWLD